MKAINCQLLSRNLVNIQRHTQFVHPVVQVILIFEEPPGMKHPSVMTLSSASSDAMLLRKGQRLASFKAATSLDAKASSLLRMSLLSSRIATSECAPTDWHSTARLKRVKPRETTHNWQGHT